MFLSRRRGAVPRRPAPPPDPAGPPRVAFMLAPLLLPALPPAAIERGAAILLRRLGRAQPGLMAALAALPPSRIGIAAAELPCRLVLRLGGLPPSLRRAAADEAAPDAALSGRLAALIALLEGRIDGDALFFSRELTVTGDSAVVVTLRNTLDRHAIDLTEMVLGALGPLAGPARALGQRLDRLGFALRVGLEAAHAAHHAALAAVAPPAADPTEALRGEMRRLATRLARLERRTDPSTEPPAP